MRVTLRQLKRVIRESLLKEYGITGNVSGGSNVGRAYLDVVMELLAAGDIEEAAQRILDSFMMDDTWPKEEEALEAMLQQLGPEPAASDVDAVAKEWYAGYKAGEFQPAQEEHEAEWSRGADRARARSAKRRSHERMA